MLRIHFEMYRGGRRRNSFSVSRSLSLFLALALAEYSRCSMQYRTTLTDKRKTNDKKESNEKKLPFKLCIFYTVSNGIQSIERHLHDIIMKWKFQ